MNYTSPYTPNYGAPAAAYPQQAQYDAAALDAFAQAQQHAAALEQLQQMYGGASPYAMTYTGQSMPGTMAPLPIGAEPAKLTPLQGAWWQQNTYGVPRWALGAGALALTGIGLAWQAGVFGGKGGSRTTSRSTTRRSTSRDASRGARTTISRTSPRGRTTTLSTTNSDSARDMSGRGRRRKTAKRRSSSSRSRRRY